MDYKIYGLRVKGDNNIRYIGYTKRELHTRLYHHLYDAKRGLTYRKCNWIRKNDYNIEIVSLLDNLSYEKALEMEKLYISKYDNLTNMTKGGEINPMNNPIVREKHKESMSKLDKSKTSHFGSSNWMTTDSGKKWFSENNPMKNEISRNKCIEAAKKYKKEIDYDLLYNLYITNNFKLTEVAERLNTTYRSVVRNLGRLGIKKYKAK